MVVSRQFAHGFAIVTQAANLRTTAYNNVSFSFGFFMNTSMNISEIGKIYRFYRDNEQSLSSLKEAYLWFSKMEQFNDPFESKVIESDIGIDELSKDELIIFLKTNPDVILSDKDSGKACSIHDLDLDKLDKSMLQQISSQLSSIIFKIIRKIQGHKFHCMSHDLIGSPLNNKLMWSHYSNGMRGFVVEYHFDELLDSLKNIESSFTGYNLIHYRNQSFRKYLRSEIQCKKLVLLNEYIFSKHTDWKYEGEIRLISPLDKLFYDPQCISRIVIGERMDSTYREQVQKIAQQNGLSGCLYKAVIDRQDYSIEVQEMPMRN
jgi:hypothetical protein